MFILALAIIAPGLFCYLVLPDPIAGLKMVAFFGALSVPAVVFGLVQFFRERRAPPQAVRPTGMRQNPGTYDDDLENMAAPPGFFDIDAGVQAANESWAQRQHDERLSGQRPW